MMNAIAQAAIFFLLLFTVGGCAYILNPASGTYESHVDLSAPNIGDDVASTVTAGYFTLLIGEIDCYFTQPARAKRITVNPGRVSLSVTCEDTAYLASGGSVSYTQADFTFEALSGHDYKITVAAGWSVTKLTLKDLTTSEIIQPEEEKLPWAESIADIQSGVTDRDTARSALGDPSLTFSGDRWWLFHARRRTPDGEFVRNSLIIEFSERNVIRDFAVVNEEHNCTEDRLLCVVDGMLEVSSELDRLIPPTSNGCKLLTCLESRPKNSQPIAIELDQSGAPLKLLEKDQCYRLDVGLGLHTLEAMTRTPDGHVYTSTQVECQAGRTTYILAQSDTEVGLKLAINEEGADARGSLRVVLMPD